MKLWVYCAKQSMPSREKQILYDFSYMWNKTQIQEQNREQIGNCKGSGYE